MLDAVEIKKLQHLAHLQGSDGVPRLLHSTCRLEAPLKPSVAVLFHVVISSGRDAEQKNLTIDSCG